MTANVAAAKFAVVVSVSQPTRNAAVLGIALANISVPMANVAGLKSATLVAVIKTVAR
jgi:hypothetical protein